MSCQVSAEKYAHSLMGVSLYVTSCFSLTAFNVLFLSLTCDILIIMCFGVSPLSYSCLEISWLPGSELLSVFFPRIGKSLVIISSNKISIPFCLSSPSGSPMMQRLVHLISHKSLKLSSLFHSFFFLLLWLGELHCPVFKLIHSFFCFESAIEPLYFFQFSSILQLCNFSLVIS